MRVIAFGNAVLGARASRPQGGRRADLGDRYFRSRWEANYARYLNWLVAHKQIREWEYEPVTFKFDWITRGTRSYTPDFRVVNRDGSREYHEIKGMMSQKAATALKRMAKHFPNVKIVLVDGPYYRDIARKLGPMIEGWE